MTESEKAEMACESCTMPIESGHYCAHCVGADGELIAFEEAFERMVQWARRHDPDLSQADAERQTYGFMKERPAWREHPTVVAATGGAR